jgi:hypothetical protein
MSEIIIEEINPKKPQSEALKRAKAKYYSKKKLDPEFMEQNRNIPYLIWIWYAKLEI